MSLLSHCIYTWKCKNKIAILALYIDDILLASNCSHMMNKTKEYWGSKFEMNDMGRAGNVLVI